MKSVKSAYHWLSQLIRRDAPPNLDIQTWMESLANVEIQVITKIKNVY
jgi:hypothetical protein